MKKLEKILLCLDLEKEKLPSLDVPINLGKHFHSTFYILYVVEYTLYAEPTPGALKVKGQERMEEVKKLFQNEGIAVESTKVEIGEIVDEINQMAQEFDVNCIILGASDQSLLGRKIMGSTVEQVMRESNKPVFAIRQDKEPGFQHILVPVDFSKTSKRALDNGIKLARSYNSQLTIITVIPDVPSSIFMKASEKEEIKEKTISSAKESMGKFLSYADLHNVNHNTVIKIGKPSKEIVTFAEENNNDLIVIGTKGNSNLINKIIGSTAAAVMRDAPCSLVTVKEDDLLHVDLQKSIEDLNLLYFQGQQLLKDGFLEEALERFNQAILIDKYFVHAWNAIADVYERMKEPEKAEGARVHAKMIDEWVWKQRVESEIKGRTMSNLKRNMDKYHLAKKRKTEDRS